jgi:NAD(P)-dependent dehydrogenase (short-subunit alcohol dehydrogenase family)
MTGSVASVKGFPGFGVYAASTAALRSFARTWLNELKGRKIRVNVLSPGPIATPMQEEVLIKEAKEMFKSLIPRGKMGHISSQLEARFGSVPRCDAHSMTSPIQRDRRKGVFGYEMYRQ